MKFPKKIWVALDENSEGSLLAFTSLREAAEFSGEDADTMGRLALYDLSHKVSVDRQVKVRRER